MNTIYIKFHKIGNNILRKLKVFQRAIDFFLTSIQRKLVFTFLILVIIPMATLSIISYNIVQEKVKEKINTANNAAIYQVGINLERILNDMLTASNTLILDEDIISGLRSSNPDDSSQLYAKSREIVKRISTVQNSILNYYHPTAITIMDTEGYAYTTLPKLALEAAEEFNELRCKEAVNQSGNYLKWSDSLHQFDVSGVAGERSFIVLIRSIFDPSSVIKVGDMMVIISESQFSSILKRLITFEGAKAYLVNDKGVILSSTSDEDLGSILRYYHKIEMTSDTQPIIVESDKENVNVNIQIIGKNNWMVVQEFPYDIFFLEFSQLRNQIIAIDITFLLLFLGISYLVAKSISNPINCLNIASKEIALGNFNVRVSVKSRDEVKQLASSFNIMVSKIQEMMQQINENERAKRELELQVLYAQINPHFLFNTLNSIRWMADASRVFNVSKMIIALSNLLNNSILKSGEIISIQEEIENVKNYIFIQKMRFASFFDVEYDVPKEIMEYKTLKFILQPIVENSIIHGFADISYKGMIRISGRLDNKRILLFVSDNGIGINEEKIRRIMINNVERKGNFSGIGVSNVNERLVMHFGEEYALKITGKQSKGTTVQIILPAIM